MVVLLQKVHSAKVSECHKEMSLLILYSVYYLYYHLNLRDEDDCCVPMYVYHLMIVIVVYEMDSGGSCYLYSGGAWFDSSVF
jgi:hypothetical protein